MANDLVGRLRAWSSTVSEECLYLEAADEIERLRAALREIAEMQWRADGAIAYQAIARQALEGK